MSEYLFTSESVSEGHPDKVADQVSDAILDAILAQDPKARVAAETLVNTGLCVLAGEITTTAQVDYIKVARETIKRIGYNSSELGFDANGCAVGVYYDQQSPDIAQGVNEGEGIDLNQGAGDQGLMFGYACDETPTLMPFAIYYSHRLMQRQSELRKDGRLPWLRPDAKAQLTVVYDSETGKVKRIDTVVLSTQHDPSIGYEELKNAVIENIIKPVLPSELLTDETKYLINPTGRFVIGGPQGDCGLTGRKSSSIPTAALLRTAAAHSPAKTRPKWTVPPLTPAAMLRKTSSPPVWQPNAKSKFPTPSALPNRLRFPSILSVPAKSAKKN